MTAKLQGLVAATHTPFHADGSLNLTIVERQAQHLLATGVQTAFIGGTTGESQSLAVAERLALATRWAEVIRGSALKLIVHVGSNCLADARALAAHAQTINATAISAFAPSYFKPKSIDLLIACCADIAAAAPALPFYYYDIPSMTGVQFPMSEFLATAPPRIPTLTGIKFTNADLMAYQQCLAAADGRFDIPFGSDEFLLAALALGATSAVGSTYNFAAPIYHRLLTAFTKGDLITARAEQLRSVKLVSLLARFGYMPAAKTVMSFLGVDVGPARLPHGNLTPDQRTQLKRSLDELEFFKWIES